MDKPYILAVPTGSQTLQPQDTQLLSITILINGFQAKAIIDSGSTQNLISNKFIAKHDLPFKPIANPIQYTFGNNQSSTADSAIIADINLANFNTTEVLAIAPLPVEVILGRPFLKKHQAIEDHRHDTINLNGTLIQLHQTDTPNAVLLTTANSMNRLLQDKRNMAYFTFLKPTSQDSTPQLKHDKPQHYNPQVQQLLLEFQDVFQPPNSLPPNRKYAHEIVTAPQHQPYARTPIPLSHFERTELQKIIKQLLISGRIRPSDSPYAAPVILVVKPNGKIRLTVDYRSLNRDTLINRFPLPLISEILDRLSPSEYYSSMDLADGYWQLLMHENSIQKTGFVTPDGHYEWLVLPQGLAGAPGSFQRIINETFQEWDFIQCYLDDFIVHSTTFDEHLVHLRRIFERLREKKFFLSLTKCTFATTTVSFLGHQISQSTVRVDPNKLQPIRTWKYPTNVSELRSVLGYANYYRRLIPQFANLTIPLNNLLRKGTPWKFEEQHRNAFDDLKTALLADPIIHLPDLNGKFMVHCDASNYAIASVLLQNDKVVACESRTLRDAELRYPIRDKEYLAVVGALKAFRKYLYGNQFVVLTDHCSLQYIMSQPLTPRHARWLSYICEFGNINVKYQQGKDNVLADALTRIESATVEKQHSTVLLTTTWNSQLLEQIKLYNKTDKFLLKHLIKSPTRFYKQEDLYYLNDPNCSTPRLYIPAVKRLRLDLVKEAHESQLSLHRGVNQTYHFLRQRLFWPNMLQEVRQFVLTCDVCARIKYATSKPQGLLQPLPVPTANWESCAMDFATNLPPTNDMDSIFIVVDRLSKRVRLIPCKTSITAQQTADLFFGEIVKHHGLPNSIVSDRDVKFTSKFFQALMKLTGTQLMTSSASHQETDGQSERMLKIVKELFRINPYNWMEHLPAIEFTINASINSSTGYAPFQLDCGRIPRTTVPQATVNNPAAEEFLQNFQAQLSAAKDNLLMAQDNYSFYANHKRNKQTFQTGDKVFVHDSVYSTNPSKTNPQWHGPFEILEIQFNTSAKLQLPAISKKYPVFHFSQLKKHLPSPPRFHNRTVLDLDEMLPLEDGEYRVESIIATKRIGGKTYYLVHWKDFSDSEDSWEPTSALMKCRSLIREFHLRRKLLKAKDRAK